MAAIPITSKVNYKVELADGEYYPALLDIVDFDEKEIPYLKKDGFAEILFYLPNKRDKLSLISRSLNVEDIPSLNFPSLKEGTPKVFIHKGLAQLLVDGEFSEIPTSKIKSASEINDYKKYFNIFNKDDNHSPDFFYE